MTNLSKRLVMIPLALLVSILAGCVTIKTTPQIPIKPAINWPIETDSGVCFPHRDAALLFQYIVELESEYIR